MEELELIVKEEEERIRLRGEEEKERLMNVLREKKEDVSCPLCRKDHEGNMECIPDKCDFSLVLQSLAYMIIAIF